MTLSYLKLGLYCPSLLVDAIMSLMEFSSRMKDHYDIYYISKNAFIREPFETLLAGERFNKKWSSRNGEWT